MAFKAKFLFINEKLLPKNIFKEIKKICHPAIKSNCKLFGTPT